MKQSFLLRLPETKFQKLKKTAKNSGVSINEYVNSLLEKNPKSEILNSNHLDNKIYNLIKSSSIFPDLKAIILFGSMAKGIETETSDCDLLLVLSNDSVISRALYRKWDIEIAENITPAMSKGRDISPHFVKFSNNLEDIHGLWLEVSISGIILWSKDFETESLLQKIRLGIADGKFIRKLTHGQPYWIRHEKEILG